MSKTYSKNGVEYGFSPVHKKWVFKSKFADGRDYMYLECANGIEKASKIASAVSASLKRNFADASNGLDALAKGTIKKILAS